MNPSAELASKVLDRLEKEKLLSADQRKRIAEKLVQGKLKQEDWRSAIELSMPKEDGHGS
ncbi:hypothetical protein AB6Q56_02465 [Dechloromonas sp. ARDL1]|uniref:hypothetical protein n=1 Tax=Dechloromonas sp. ARDL1 TaxID=3322121 RepID=UPI003DA79159